MSIRKIQRGTISDKPEVIPEDVLFLVETIKDTTGKSGANAMWGDVYVAGREKRTGLHKDFDYDAPLAAYAEKVWSIIGKKVLEKTRVPDIEIVNNPKYGDGIISYRIMDNDLEDMLHVQDLLFNIYDRTEINKHKSIFSIDEVLKAIKSEVTDEENFQEIKEAVIKVLLLDAVTNNADRHTTNWGIVRNKQTNHFDLAVFDHSSAFVSMMEYNPFFKGSWISSYITTKKEAKYGMGEDGNVVIKYIAETYPEYYEEFVNKYLSKLPEICEEIDQTEGLKINKEWIKSKLNGKGIYLKRILERGEIYED